MDYVEYVRQRIDELRLLQGHSEREMSLRLGKGEDYIHAISSKRAKPGLSAFFEICEYFHISPAEFFDPGLHNPDMVKEAMAAIQELHDEDILRLKEIADRLPKRKSNLRTCYKRT